jgi:hypothetical protein
MPPTPVDQIAFDLMTFSDPFTNRNGGHSAFPNMGERGKVEFQLQQERAPFGVNMTDPNGNPVSKRYNFALSVENDNNLRGLEAFDARVVEYFHKNAKTYWPKKKKLTLEDVKRMYRPVLAPASDPDKYSPLVRLKVHADEENPNGKTRIFVVTKNADGADTYAPDGTIADISRNAQVTVVVRASCAWMLGGGIQFGVTLKVQHALVYPTHDNQEEFPFSMPAGMAAPVKNERKRKAPTPTTTTTTSAVDEAFNAASESLTTEGLAAALTAAGVIPAGTGAGKGAGAGAGAGGGGPPLKKQRAVVVAK